MAAKSIRIGYGSCASRPPLNLRDCFSVCRRTLPLQFYSYRVNKIACALIKNYQ